MFLVFPQTLLETKSSKQCLDKRLKAQGMQAWLRDQEVNPVQVAQEDQEVHQEEDLLQAILKIEDHHPDIQTIGDHHKVLHKVVHPAAHQVDREVHHQAILKTEVHHQVILRTEALHQVIQVVHQQEELLKITFSATQIHSADPRSDDFIIIESF